MNNNTTVSVRGGDIRALIQSDKVKEQMAMVLPRHLTPDRMARVACTALLKTPKLATCKPESLLQALMLCSQAGLEPDGRHAHLIPYGDQVQVIFDYRGLVALARRNGIQNIAAEVVCANDVFEWWRDGDGLHFKHMVDWRKPRGDMFATFCIWKDGEQFDGEVMTVEEVEGIRKRSKAGESGPWKTDYNEMAKKTVIRRASKKWPLEAELAETFNSDADMPQITVAAPVSFTAPQIAEPEPEIAPAVVTPETQPEPPSEQPAPEAQKPKEAPEPSRAAALTTYFLDECKMDYAAIAPVLKKLGVPKDADSYKSFDEMPEKDLLKVWQSRRGIRVEALRSQPPAQA